MLTKRSRTDLLTEIIPNLLIETEGAIIPCHLEIVTAGNRFGYLNSLLHSGMKESRLLGTEERKIRIQEIESKYLLRLIDYLYVPIIEETISFDEICQLHQIADRFLFPDFKDNCRYLLLKYLNEVTIIPLIRYLLEEEVNDPLLDTGTLNFIENSDRFQDEIVTFFETEEELKLLFRRFPMTPMTRCQIILSWYLSHPTDELKSELEREIPSVLKQIDPRRNILINKIRHSRNIDLLDMALREATFFMGFMSEPTIWKIANNDIDSFSVDQPITRITRDNIRFFKLNISYRASSEWVLRLPTGTCEGFKINRSDSSYSTILNFDADGYSAIGPIFRQIEELVQVALRRYSDSFQFPPNQSRDNQLLEDSQILDKLSKFHRTEDRIPILNDQNQLPIKIVPTSVLRSFSSGDQINPDHYQVSAVTKLIPLFLHRGLIRFSVLVFRYNVYFQRRLLFGYIEKK